jgi:hypothetical protein
LESWKAVVTPSPSPSAWSPTAGVFDGAQDFQSDQSRSRKPCARPAAISKKSTISTRSSSLRTPKLAS